MPRTKTVVDKTILAGVIGDLEHDHQFNTRSALAQAVGERMSISPSVVLLRIKEFGLEPKTPKGKRGRQKGMRLSADHKKAMQAGRKQKKDFDITSMRNEFPESYSNLLDRVAKGSLAATIKAKCLECTQFHKAEITYCTCDSCPLYNVRPYQKKG